MSFKNALICQRFAVNYQVAQQSYIGEIELLIHVYVELREQEDYEATDGMNEGNSEKVQIQETRLKRYFQVQTAKEQLFQPSLSTTTTTKKLLVLIPWLINLLSLSHFNFLAYI